MTYCSNACSDGVRDRRRDASAGHDAARHFLDDGEEIGQVAALDDLGVGAADVDPDRPRAHGERVAVDRHVADDHLRGADELADLDHRGAAERRAFGGRCS